MSYFSNQQAAISGAGSGIGRARAGHPQAVGAELWLSDVDKYPRLLRRACAALEARSDA